MTEEESKEEVWKKFLKKHWKMALLIVGGIVGAILGGIFVFLWLVGKFQAEALVPTVLGQWTVGYIVTFVLNIILWMIIIVGIPVIVAIILVYLLWYRELPEEERAELEGEPKTKKTRARRTAGGGGGMSFIVTITWLIIVYANGMWNTVFTSAQWTIDYLVSSWLSALFWDFIIIGIPVIVLIIIWILYEPKKET